MVGQLRFRGCVGQEVVVLLFLQYRLFHKNFGRISLNFHFQGLCHCTLHDFDGLRCRLLSTGQDSLGWAGIDDCSGCFWSLKAMDQ